MEVSILFLFYRRILTKADLHPGNFLLEGLGIDGTKPDTIKETYRLDKCPLSRVDGQTCNPVAPPYAVYAIDFSIPCENVTDTIVMISDFGTSFLSEKYENSKLYTTAIYLPPEHFFNERITQAADIWTLGVSLYEVLGETQLFETFTQDPGGIVSAVSSTLGPPPARWWEKWRSQGGKFGHDGNWMRDMNRLAIPTSRSLRQRLWHMGRGETMESCEWDVGGGEMDALEAMLAGMLAYEPSERLTAEQLLSTDYVVDWAMPAWKRQEERRG